jgi:SPP1 family predicted phage head-tail adaptor
MKIGRMDKRIQLQAQVRTSDGQGGYSTEWVTQATVWAEFKKPSFDTKDVAGAVASVSLREIKIRYCADVVKGWRVLYGTKIYPVDHTYDIGKSETFLVCKEVVK